MAFIFILMNYCIIMYVYAKLKSYRIRNGYKIVGAMRTEL